MSFYQLNKINKYRSKFFIKNIDVSLVNSIRRTILDLIPNVAFSFDIHDYNKSDITIHKNTGVLHNEFIAHRISLLPIHFNIEEIDDFNPENYKFVLKVKNTSPETILVTTKDFEIYDKNDKKYSEAFREQLFPKDTITGDYILITKLKPNLYDISNGQELDIECVASKSIASIHARWCPVSQCSYGNVIDIDTADIEFKKSIDLKEKELGKKINETQKISMRTQFNALNAFRYFKKNIYDEPSDFEFFIESECNMTPEYLVSKAFTILIDKIKKFIELLNANEYNIIELPQSKNFFEIHVTNETYTLINLLQAMIFNINFRQSTDNILESISYYRSHPLEPIMILKIKFINSIDNKDNKQFLKNFIEKNCNQIIETISNYQLEWVEFITP
jgi:DNA-directed RNA polymerase alpha subunit